MDDPISPPYADPYQPFWAPPDPATRRDVGAPPPAAPPPPRPPQRHYRGRVTAVVVCLAVLLGLVAYATLGNGSSGTGAPTFNARPARHRRPADAPPPRRRRHRVPAIGRPRWSRTRHSPSC